MLYFVFTRLMLIAITSSMWVCHFCLADIMNPQGNSFRRIQKMITFGIIFSEMFGIAWAARLLLAKTLRTIRRLKQPHSQAPSTQ